MHISVVRTLGKYCDKLINNVRLFHKIHKAGRTFTTFPRVPESASPILRKLYPRLVKRHIEL